MHLAFVARSVLHCSSEKIFGEREMEKKGQRWKKYQACLLSIYRLRPSHFAVRCREKGGREAPLYTVAAMQ